MNDDQDRRQHDIYVRAHTVVQVENKSTEKKDGNHKHDNGPKWPDYALIFDCESRITTDQTLTFGFWRFCQLRDGKSFSRVLLPGTSRWQHW
jgi:hypothetical protein